MLSNMTEFMRRRHYQQNGIKHAEIWDTGCGLEVVLCRNTNSGWYEAGPFVDDSEARAWLAEFAPELPIKD